MIHHLFNPELRLPWFDAYTSELVREIVGLVLMIAALVLLLIVLPNY
jgi:hypothetical protein